MKLKAAQKRTKATNNRQGMPVVLIDGSDCPAFIVTEITGNKLGIRHGDMARIWSPLRDTSIVRQMSANLCGCGLRNNMVYLNFDSIHMLGLQGGDRVLAEKIEQSFESP